MVAAAVILIASITCSSSGCSPVTSPASKASRNLEKDEFRPSGKGSCGAADLGRSDGEEERRRRRCTLGKTAFLKKYFAYLCNLLYMSLPISVSVGGGTNSRFRSPLLSRADLVRFNDLGKEKGCTFTNDVNVRVSNLL